MDPIERLLAERECERLTVAYAHLSDTGGTVADLFTEDGVLDLGFRRSEGREAIRAAAGPGDRIMHHQCSTFGVDFSDDSNGKGVTYLNAYLSPKVERPEVRDPFMIARYHDQFQKTSEGWRIKERTLEIVFQRPQ